jgi:hypothetical protein
MSRPVQFFAGLAGFAFLAGAPFVFAAAQPPERVSLAVLLDRARWYLDDFVDEFENVVAEETYIQDSAMLLPSFSPVAGGRAGVFASPPDSGRARHRELRSDFLLAKSPATDSASGSGSLRIACGKESNRRARKDRRALLSQRALRSPRLLAALTDPPR